MEGLFDRNLAPVPAPEPAIGCGADAGDPGRPDGCRGRPLRLRGRAPRPLRRRERLDSQRPGGAGAQSGGGGHRRAGAGRRRLGLRGRARQRARRTPRPRWRARSRSPRPSRAAAGGASPLAPEPPAHGLVLEPGRGATRSRSRSRTSSPCCAAADAGMQRRPARRAHHSRTSTRSSQDKLFASTEGALCEQQIVECGGGISAAAVERRARARSAPTRRSHGGTWRRPATSTSSRSTCRSTRRAWRRRRWRFCAPPACPAERSTLILARRAAGAPGPRVGRPRRGARPRARARGLVRRHQLRAGRRPRLAPLRLRAR